MAQVTSAMAAKYLKKLNEEHEALLRMERKSFIFRASIQENKEDARPAYDYLEVQKRLLEIEDKIRRIRHEINCFNQTQTVPGFQMTIDQMLVYIPQLTARKQKLNMMRGRLPKERIQSGLSGGAVLVEYEYSNYDPEQAEADYNRVSEELAKAQNALDLVNSSVMFEAEIG